MCLSSKNLHNSIADFICGCIVLRCGSALCPCPSSPPWDRIRNGCLVFIHSLLSSWVVASICPSPASSPEQNDVPVQNLVGKIRIPPVCKGSVGLKRSSIRPGPSVRPTEATASGDRLAWRPADLYCCFPSLALRGYQGEESLPCLFFCPVPFFLFKSREVGWLERGIGHNAK